MILALLLLAAPPPDESFKPWLEKDGVAISISRGEEKSIPWIRGAKTLDASCESVEKLLTDWDSYAKTLTPMVKKSAVLERGEGSARLHVIWPYPWPLRARDGIIRYQGAREDGRTAIRWEDAEKEGDPKTAGVRIKDIEGSAMLVPDGEKCSVTYTFYGDLGGDFGKSSNEKAWKGEAPHWFDAVAKALLAGTKRP